MVQFFAQRQQLAFPKPGSSVLMYFYKFVYLTRNLALLSTVEKFKMFIESHVCFRDLDENILSGSRNHGIPNKSYLYIKEATTNLNRDTESSAQIQLFETLTQIVSYAVCMEKYNLVKYLLKLGLPLKLYIGTFNNFGGYREKLEVTIARNFHITNKTDKLLKFLENNAKELQLRALNLYRLNINQERLKTVTRFLKETSTLYHLNLSRNYIDDCDMHELAEVLASNTSLISLNLENNTFITEAALIDLVNNLEKNKHLLQLTLSPTLAAKPSYQQLMALMKRNQQYVRQRTFVACTILKAARIFYQKLNRSVETNHITALPSELKCRILSYLDPDNLLSDRILSNIIRYALDPKTLGTSRDAYLQHINTSFSNDAINLTLSHSDYITYREGNRKQAGKTFRYFCSYPVILLSVAGFSFFLATIFKNDNNVVPEFLFFSIGTIAFLLIGISCFCFVSTFKRNQSNTDHPFSYAPKTTETLLVADPTVNNHSIDSFLDHHYQATSLTGLTIHGTDSCTINRLDNNESLNKEDEDTNLLLENDSLSYYNTV